MQRTGNGAVFDGRAFMERLDQARFRYRNPKSWRQVGAEAHVSPSTFTQLRSGHSPDAVTLGRLLAWLEGDEPWWMTTAP